MAFYGCDFIFNGRRASDFGLMLYNIGSYAQDDVDFSVGEIVEDRISRRYDSLLYGLVQNEPLQFRLVFGMDPDDLEGEAHLTRSEIADITEWLTGHRSYKILKIDQADMSGYRYHAMVTGLQLIADGGLPTAFSAEITCDSPFAYKDPLTYILNLSSTQGVLFPLDNHSQTNGYYYPVFEAEVSGCTYLSFENASDGNRIMRIDNIPTDSDHVIRIDCQNQIITSSLGYNLYPGFNKTFLRLVPGENNILITTDGSGTLSTICEYPVNIGA